MKNASCFLYIVLTIVYCLYSGDMRALMYLIGQCTILLFIVPLCAFILRPSPITEVERLFLLFSVGMTVSRVIYTVVCVFMEQTWVWNKTDVFGMITALCFLVLLLHICFFQITKK